MQDRTPGEVVQDVVTNGSSRAVGEFSNDAGRRVTYVSLYAVSQYV
jgi:hypothetical protein